MAKTLKRYESEAVTLAATCNQITTDDGRKIKSIVVYESDVTFYVCPTAADGAALPATFRKGPFSPADCPVEINLEPYARPTVSIAGSGAGTAHCEVW